MFLCSPFVPHRAQPRWPAFPLAWQHVLGRHTSPANRLRVALGGDEADKVLLITYYYPTIKGPSLQLLRSHSKHSRARHPSSLLPSSPSSCCPSQPSRLSRHAGPEWLAYSWFFCLYPLRGVSLLHGNREPDSPSVCT